MRLHLRTHKADEPKIRDQNGTVRAFEFDKLGRQTQDRVTTLGTGVDGTVRRLASSFEVRGMREKITSWNSETVGSGSVVNEVQFSYNDFGQLTHDYQAHGGAVNTSTSPQVQYGYASGAANTIRPTTLTYPDGRVLTSSYGSADSLADALSRVAALVDDDGGATHLADYSYLGLGTFVEVDYTEPDIEYTLVGTAGGNDPDTGDIYRGWDRFGRVKDAYWYDYGGSADVDRIKYGYDRNGNRTYRENTVATANSAYFDEKYFYDLLDRLKHMDRGRLTAQKDAVTNKTFAQCWSLDATGNWRKFLEDSDGDGSWSLDQTRTANLVNEIADITESVGPSWVTPVYNRAGNMTTIPQPADPTASFTATYDAWNRLVKLEDGSGTVAQYEYDGAKRRTIKKTYTSGVLSETRHMFYTEPAKWQVIEERVGTSTAADRQFVWGLRYVDDIVLRDRDTDANGTLDERLYGLQDANWNVTALSDVTGTIQERFACTSYGECDPLTATFASRSSSIFDWETRYSGYCFDIASALYVVRHRCYHPGAYWIQRDPLGLLSSLNLYRYASCRPLIEIDSKGLASWICRVAEDKWTSCLCFVINTIDAIAALIMPFLQTLTPPIGQWIQAFLSALDCLCDVIGGVSEYCSGCLKGTEIGSIIGSCAIDLLSIFVPKLGVDPAMLAGMFEFIFYVLAQVNSGRGIGVESCPVGLKACLELAQDYGALKETSGIVESCFPRSPLRVGVV